MKNLVILLFFSQYIFCKNLHTDSSRNNNQYLEELPRSSQKLIESGKYSFSSAEPVTINQDDITLHVYTKADQRGAEINLTDADDITTVSSFDTNLKTVFYVHGWMETVEDLGSVITKQALLEAENVNVIIVNWDKCAMHIDYFISVRCVPEVGKYLGQFVETVGQKYKYSLSDITVVGHSLGAHIAGHIGKYTNGTLGIIVGLDPAGPFFFQDMTDARLTKDDAQYVQAIHTNAFFLGLKFNVGHVDFWPDGGYFQNGCGLDAECSHINAYRYYAESVTNNAFFARQCDSYDNFKQNKCNQNAKTLMGGVNLDTSATGDYYLNTNAQSPFGMGDVV